MHLEAHSEKLSEEGLTYSHGKKGHHLPRSAWSEQQRGLSLELIERWAASWGSPLVFLLACCNMAIGPFNCSLGNPDFPNGMKYQILHLCFTSLLEKVIKESAKGSFRIWIGTHFLSLAEEQLLIWTIAIHGQRSFI